MRWYNELSMNNVIYKRELNRKILHIITGLIFITSAFIFKDIDAVFWTGVILLIPFSLFYLVVRWFRHTMIGRSFFHSVEREQGNYTNGIGGLSFTFGVLLSYILFGFNPAIVIVSILVLSFGDGFASYIGMRFGRHKFNIDGHTKTLEGTFAGIIAATVASSFFVDFFTALIVSSLTMIIELVGIRVRGREIPDNIYIPVISGLIMYILILFK